MYSNVKKKIPQLETTINLLDKLAKNIIDNPKDVKYQSFKTSNVKISQNLLKFKAAVKILEYYGFIKSQNENGEE